MSEAPAPAPAVAPPTTEEQMARLMEKRANLDTQLASAQAGARLRILQELLSVEKELARMNSAPQMAELVRLKGERDALGKTISEMETNLIEIGAIEKPKAEVGVVRRKKAATGEGAVTETVRSFNAEKATTSPEARAIAAILRERNSIAEGDLEGAITPYHLSGTALVILRWFRDNWHLIDFEGAPAGALPTGVTVRTYRWVATVEALAAYNDALKKAGRESL